MARTIAKETVSNLRSRFESLRVAVTNQKTERENMQKGLTNNTLTPDALKDAMNRILKLEREAAENAEYLSSVFRVYMTEVGKVDPAAIVGIFLTLEGHVENIAEVVNESRDETRQKQKEAKAREIRAAADALLAKVSKK